MGTPRWWEILLPASARSAEYARLDPGRVRRSICRALVTVCQLQPSRPRPSVSSLGPGQSLGQAARRASTNSWTPSITKVGGVCSNPSGRATFPRVARARSAPRRQTRPFLSGFAGDSRCIRCPARRPGSSDARPDVSDESQMPTARRWFYRPGASSVRFIAPQASATAAWRASEE
jgi:hypothetical protein